MLVLISHVEMVKGGLKVSNIYSDGSFTAHALESLGPMGVTFFFVLSGFLITFLLLSEKKKTATVQVKSFYIRRALRIWPIYFLFTIAVFFVLPKIEIFNHYYFSNPTILYNSFYSKLAMYLLFIPGFVLAFFESIPWAGHLWSIGVEEQFYLVWPWFAKKVRTIKLYHFMYLLIGIVFIKAAILLLYFNGAIGESIKQIAAQSKFECMIFGGAGAWLVFYKKIDPFIHKLVKTRVILSIFIVCIAIIWFLPQAFDDISHLLLSPLFVMIILGVSFGHNRKWLEKSIFIKLGNLSYSFYLFHMVCIVMIVKLMPDSINYWCSNNSNGNIIINVLYYAGSIVLTTLLSGLSFKIIERPILKYKAKFAIIKSGKI
jgi:peptidoglycan/LPS O-acetylase OafA/YrhL